MAVSDAMDEKELETALVLRVDLGNETGDEDQISLVKESGLPEKLKDGRIVIVAAWDHLKEEYKRYVEESVSGADLQNQAMVKNVKDVTEQPVSEKILSRGFRCCILILLVFTVSLLFFQKGISYAIDGSVNSQVAYLKEIFGAMHGKNLWEAADQLLENLCVSWSEDGYVTSCFLVLFLAMTEGIFLWQHGMAKTYPLLLTFVGLSVFSAFTAQSSTGVEMYILILLASGSFRHLYRFHLEKLRLTDSKKVQEKAENERRAVALKEEEEELKQLRQEAMKSRFDMGDALKKGYINISVSEAYEKEQKSCKKDDPES